MGHYPITSYVKAMTPELQTIATLTLVVLAVGYLAVRWLKARKKPGCGGGCGCSAGKKF